MPTSDDGSDFPRQEYLALSEQKAADFRTITGAVPTLFTVSGAILVAGLTQQSAYAVVIASVPMLLAVYQMAQNSRLQLTMSTFLSVCSPATGFSFEEHVPSVRQRVWDDKQWNSGLGRVWRPSAYNTWLKITITLGIIIDAFPWLAHLKEWPAATIVGLVVLASGGGWVWRIISRIEPERTLWTAEWKRALKAHKGDG